MPAAHSLFSHKIDRASEADYKSSGDGAAVLSVYPTNIKRYDCGELTKMKMIKRWITPFLSVAMFATATMSQAAVHQVSPGESIQAAIDAASPGDTIMVEPGVYNENASSRFGLRITTDNLRLIGKPQRGQGDAGKVILTPATTPVPGGGVQETGVYAAPDSCTPEDEVGDEFCESNRLQGFYIRGFTVHGYEWNGIQTRFVNDFTIVGNEAHSVGINGIYPTISANGLVENNVAYGTMDTAMWVAASENVKVIGNDLSGAPIGLEVNVSVDIEVKRNYIHDNTVGIALFHPNTAGNLPRDDMGNWLVKNNNIYDNNLENPAPPESFQGALPRGIGILLLGVSDNVVEKNIVEDNNFVGIGVLDWCTAGAAIGRSCEDNPPITSPEASNNLISRNTLERNGLDPDESDVSFLAADLTYADGGDSSGNCFENNKPAGEYSYISTEADGELPTDGC